MAEMADFHAAGYLVEGKRRWPVIQCFPTRTVFKINLCCFIEPPPSSQRAASLLCRRVGCYISDSSRMLTAGTSRTIS